MTKYLKTEFLSKHTFMFFVYSYSLQNYNDISGFSFELTALDMEKDYAFRLRMRLDCTQKNWGEWSPIKYWKNDTSKGVSTFCKLYLLAGQMCSLV